ncbi:trypsin-like serine protease [Silvanigrella paludirubra]|uniref:Trypsin-like serine protease n=1 Tax=Silvanigrella paludirubra TaxID=2499159 RepID=A0A6N6VZE2_9BACT|nr:trypsin-like serine protease [Silvanigrella paludirubra]KAB8040656.1 trypsin-like serine protease [Silvanigrella paludirubra]
MKYFSNLLLFFIIISNTIHSCNKKENESIKSNKYCENIDSLSYSNSNKIVNGCEFNENILNIFPESKSVVSIVSGSGLCSGTFIAENIILTAAHCFDINKLSENKKTIDNEIKNITIYSDLSHEIYPLNKNELNTSSISSITIHPFFQKYCSNKNNISNGFHKCNFADLALLKTTKKASEIGAKVSKLTTNDSKDETIIIVGYGKNNDIEIPTKRIKKWAFSRIYEFNFIQFSLSNITVDNNSYISLGEFYKTIMSPFITPSYLDDPRKAFLFIEDDNYGICQGDSGGPLFVKKGNEFLAVGVVHANIGKAPQICEYKKSININIGAYREWLINETKLLGENITFY